MSVLSRLRSVSELEFYKNGKDIRSELTKYLMSEKHVPKRYSFVFRYPGIDLARMMIDEITAANTIYPQNEDDLKRRREHQTRAIIKCEQIIQHIQWMVDTLDNVKLSQFEILGEKVIKEVTLLKAWREKNRIYGSEKG